MRIETIEPHSRAFRFFLAAALVTGAWLGVNFWFPNLAATGIPSGVTRMAIDGIILIGLWRGLARTDFTAGARMAVWLGIAIPLVLWTAVVWGLAAHGVFRAIPGAIRVFPALPVAIFVPVLLGIVLLMRSRRIAELLDVVPTSWLIGLQVYRVMGGMFLVYWAHGTLPGVFALPAGIGDVSVGLMALPAAIWVASGTPAGKRAGMRWNLFGLADLVVAITMGMLSSPGPLQVLALNHPNVQIGTFPTVMVPALAVPSSIILHVLSLWQLRLGGQRVGAFSKTDRGEETLRPATRVFPV